MTRNAMFGVKGPDADGIVWLTWSSPSRMGMKNLGGRGDSDAELALDLGGDSAALEKALGHLVFEPERDSPGGGVGVRGRETEPA